MASSAVLLAILVTGGHSDAAETLLERGSYLVNAVMASQTRRATPFVISTWKFSLTIDWSWLPGRSRDGRIVAKSTLPIWRMNPGFCQDQTPGTTDL